MLFTNLSRARDFKTINNRNLEYVVEFQFLYDLYGQFQGNVSPYRYRNVVGIYHKGQARMLTPVEDWRFVADGVFRNILIDPKSFIRRLAPFLSPCWKEVDAKILNLDTLDLMSLETVELINLFIEEYYFSLNHIFPMNRVPYEQGLQLYIDYLGRSNKVSNGDILDLMTGLQSVKGATVNREKALRFEIARNDPDGMESSSVKETVEYIQKIEIGYGAPCRSIQEIYEDIKEAKSFTTNTELVSQVSVKDNLLPLEIRTWAKVLVELGHVRDVSKSRLGQLTYYRKKMLEELKRRFPKESAKIDCALIQDLWYFADHERFPDRIEGRHKEPFVLISEQTAHMGAQAAAWLGKVEPVTHKNSYLGVGVSAGKFKGKALVANSASEARYVNTSQVLIVIGTDFDYVSALGNAGGVITEEGGKVSHAAVVCREEKVPCIVGVEGATRAIKTGDIVTMDGKTGEINIERQSETKNSVDPNTALALFKGKVGGKASNSLILRDEIGCPIPNFVTIGSNFFSSVLNGIVDCELKLTQESEINAVKTFLEGIDLAALTLEISKLNTDHLGPFLAVRSSGISEDSEVNSFAGIFETKLFVQNSPEDIAIAVLECWKSSLSEKALAYYRERGISHIQPYVPLMIQDMISSERSGVLFTKDPVSTADGWTIELVRGLCNLIVDGVQIDERFDFKPFTVPASTLISSAEFKTIFTEVKKIQSVLGEFVDIEFSFDADSNLWIHQARAVTA